MTVNAKMSLSHYSFFYLKKKKQKSFPNSDWGTELLNRHSAGWHPEKLFWTLPKDIFPRGCNLSKADFTVQAGHSLAYTWSWQKSLCSSAAGFYGLAIWFKWTLKKPAAVAHGWSNLTDPIGPFSLFQHILPGYLSVPLHSFCICSVVAVIIPPLCLRIMLCLCIPIA